MTALSLDALKQMIDRRNRYKAVLEERLRRLEAALEAATAVDSFVRIADRADDIGRRAARSVRCFGWLLQELSPLHVNRKLRHRY